MVSCGKIEKTLILVVIIMKDFFKKIISVIKKALFVIVSLIANLFLNEKKDPKKQESTSKNKKEERVKRIPEKDFESKTTPEDKVKGFKSSKFTMTKEELSKELKKVLKEDRKDLLETLEQKEKVVKDWHDETIKKTEELLAEDKLTDLESIQKHFKKEIKKFTAKQNLDKSPNPFIKEPLPEDILVNQTPYIDDTVLINFIETLDTQEGERTIEEQKEPLIQEEKKPKIIYETKKVGIGEILESVPVILETKEVQKTVLEEKNNSQEHVIQEEKKPFKEPPKKEEEKEKKEPKEEKLKEPITIDIAKIEKENDKLLNEATKALEKEIVLSKEYDEVLKSLEKKERELKDLLQKPLKEHQKNKIKTELQKITKMKNTLAFKKEGELESIRISLEESLSPEEKDRILEECMKWNREITEEIQKNLVIDIENKTQLEIRKLEKELMKQQLRKISNVLSFPMLLSIPFVKNKYYRMFVGGFFVFQGLNWIQSLLFRSPNTEMLPNLTAIKSGRDALEEYANSLIRNKEMLKNLRKEMLEKYPELLEDAEFLSLISSVEYNLEIEYQKCIEKTQVVNRYFKKGKKLERKLKRRWI